MLPPVVSPVEPLAAIYPDPPHPPYAFHSRVSRRFLTPPPPPTSGLAQAKWGEEHGGRASGGGGPHARCRRAGLPIRSSGSQWPSTA